MSNCLVYTYFCVSIYRYVNEWKYVFGTNAFCAIRKMCTNCMSRTAMYNVYYCIHLRNICGWWWYSQSFWIIHCSLFFSLLSVGLCSLFFFFFLFRLVRLWYHCRWMIYVYIIQHCYVCLLCRPIFRWWILYAWIAIIISVVFPHWIFPYYSQFICWINELTIMLLAALNFILWNWKHHSAHRSNRTHCGGDGCIDLPLNKWNCGNHTAEHNFNCMHTI